MKRIPISGLNAFRSVARQGSIRKGAAALKLEPSTVSHQLKALEAELGTALFVRSTRSVSLTDAGRVLLAGAVPAMEQLEAAVQRSRDAAGTRRGTLRINLPWIAFQIAIRDRLSEFRQTYPDITLDLSFSDRLSDIVAEGFHAGIRFGHRIDERMIAIPLTGPIRSTVVASPEYLAAFGNPESPQDLLEHNCLRYRFIRSQRIAQWDFQDRDKHFTVAVNGDFVADSLVALVDRVLAGQGLAHIPTDLVRSYLQDGRMVTLLDEYEFHYPALHLYYPRENKRHELLRAFVEFLRPISGT